MTTTKNNTEQIENNLPKNTNEIYCKSCGKIIKKEAQICIHCGVSNSENFYHKDKTIAILLAVFLGFWTWLYTIEKDAWKFYVNLAIWIIDILLTIVTFGYFFWISWIWTLPLWIWAIVDVSTKPKEYYSNYFHR